MEGETIKQFCVKIYLISQGREKVLFLPSNMVAMTSHENARSLSLACALSIYTYIHVHTHTYLCIYSCFEKF